MDSPLEQRWPWYELDTRIDDLETGYRLTYMPRDEPVTIAVRLTIVLEMSERYDRLCKCFL